MSTPNVQPGSWRSGPGRGRHSAPRDPPSLVAELVFRELLESDSALTEDALHERTLLPETEVREAIVELEARDLCRTRRRRDEHEPRRYVASFPSELGS